MASANAEKLVITVSPQGDLQASLDDVEEDRGRFRAEVIESQDFQYKSRLINDGKVADDVDTFRGYGTDLFQALLDPVKAAFKPARKAAEQNDGTPVRLHLVFEQVGGEVHPCIRERWECLFDPDLNCFLATDPRWVLTRELRRATSDTVEVQPRNRSDELRALFVHAHPDDLHEIGFIDQVKDEISKIDFDVDIQELRNPSVDELRESLESTFDVLHFLVHGTPGDLSLAGVDGRSFQFHGTSLSAMLGGHTPELVVLQACHGAETPVSEYDLSGISQGTADELAHSGVPAVIGFRDACQQTHAWKIIQCFYHEYAVDRDTGRALQVARKIPLPGCENLHAWREFTSPVAWVQASSIPSSRSAETPNRPDILGQPRQPGDEYYSVGIDLGTTHTVCAVWPADSPQPLLIEPAEAPPATAPEVTPGMGRPATDILPSVVAFSEEQGAEVAFAGHAAESLQPSTSVRVIRSAKTRMSETAREDQSKVTPVRVAACILAVIRTALGRYFRSAPHEIAITVPASFGLLARRHTIQAARLAGFDPEYIVLLDEPTAALLAEIKHRTLVPRENGYPQRVLVVDFGGGTLDVSFAVWHQQATKYHVDVVTSARYTALGGDHLDVHLAALILHRYEEERGSIDSLPYVEQQAFAASLVKSSRRAKEQICTGLRTHPDAPLNEVTWKIVIDVPTAHISWDTDITAEDLKTAFRPIFREPPVGDDAIHQFSFFQPIAYCIENLRQLDDRESSADARHGRYLGDHIDVVLLTGGSSRIPGLTDAVSKFVSQHAGQEPPRTVIARVPDRGIALGAAYYVGDPDEGSEFEVTHRLPEGIELRLQDGTWFELLPAHLEYPGRWKLDDRRLQFPKASNNLEMTVRTRSGVAIGESTHKRQLNFSQSYPKAQPFVLTVEIDRSGTVRIEATIDSDGRSETRTEEYFEMLKWRAPTSAPFPDLCEIRTTLTGQPYSPNL